jgi:PKD repeat protein
MTPRTRRRARLRLDALETRAVPANLLVSYTDAANQERVAEYTPAGALVGSAHAVPPNGGFDASFPNARDLVRAADDTWLVFNGTFEPTLAVYTPGTGGWSQTPYSGWSTANVTSYGGLTTAGHYAYVPDMTTFNSTAAQAKGIVRFDLTDLSAARFLSDREYTDLNMGKDGKLYGLQSDSGPVDVIDPATMTVERSVNTNAVMTARGVAADADGNLYVVSWDEAVYKLSPAGAVLNSYHMTGPGGTAFFADTQDVDLSSDGSRLAIGSRFGWVVQMAADFTGVSYFQAGDQPVFVAFNEPLGPPVVPTISVSDAAVTEGDTGTAALTFTVTLSAPTTATVTVQYATQAGTAAAGDDYTQTTGTLTFDPGQTEKTVTVDVTGDLIDETDETLSLVLSDPAGGTLADDTGAGSITDDDVTPVVSVSDPAAVTEGDPGTAAVTVTFTVTLDVAPKAAVNVRYSTRGGTATAGDDFGDVATPTPLTFEVGETQKTVTINVTADKVAEPTETFDLLLSDPTGATLGDDTATATILDTDVPPVANAGRDRTINENGVVTFRATGSSGVRPLTYTWDFGDGSPAATGFTRSHRFPDSGTFTVTLTVRDGNGSTSTDTAVVTSRNLPPRGGIAGPTRTVTGWDRPLTFTGFDPSPADKAALEYRIDWGDGSTETVFGGPKVLAGHAYAQTGDYTVRLVVADKDGATSRTYARVVHVRAALAEAGILYVTGTNLDDVIRVKALNAAGTRVQVTVNDSVAATGAPNTVVVFAGDGWDTVATDGPVRTRLVFMGGPGLDTLNAASAVGPVVLVGADGNDFMYGGSGRDVLVGGSIGDVMSGNGNDDLLLGESLSFEADPIAVRKLSLEWARAGVSYEARRDHLLGLSRGGLNGTSVLTAATVSADGNRDVMTGGDGRDWFFDPPADGNLLIDAAADETVTTTL